MSHYFLGLSRQKFFQYAQVQCQSKKVSKNTIVRTQTTGESTIIMAVHNDIKLKSTPALKTINRPKLRFEWWSMIYRSLCRLSRSQHSMGHNTLDSHTTQDYIHQTYVDGEATEAEKIEYGTRKASLRRVVGGVIWDLNNEDLVKNNRN